ncbi:MAG: glycosyl hydrolase [Crocinitomicaceae bacterium]
MTKIILTIFTIALISCNKKKKAEAYGEYQLNNLELAISFPAVENDSQRKNTQKVLSDLKVKKIRFAEEWKFREPIKDEYSWGPLDDRLNWAKENGYEVMLTIQSNGPDWACEGASNDNSCVFNTDEFKQYIEDLLQRYPNQLDKIQFGNEWQSDFWYVSTAEEFTIANNILYEAVQTYSPKTDVVLGGFTAISLRFMAGCAGELSNFKDDEGVVYDQAYLDANCTGTEATPLFNRINYVLDNASYDLLDMHLYDDPENWSAVINHFKSVTTKPVIVSEFGGPNSNYENDSNGNQAKRLYDYIVTLDSLEIEEAYYFKLVQGSKNKAHIKSGLLKGAFKSKKQSYFVFRKFSNL